MWLATLATLAVLTAGALAGQPYYDYYVAPEWDMGALYERLAALGDDYPGVDWPNDITLQQREHEAAPEQQVPAQVLAQMAPGQSATAQLRDHETLAHSAVGDGFQYISGGAGEGKQHLKPDGEQKNTQEVKTDEVLPFYCHPPNPCPKGKTAANDGCHESVQDTADAQQQWILKMQSRGMCACDDEHMFNCPRPDDDHEDYPQYEDDELDQVLDRLLGEEHAENPYIMNASKREFLVAKKG